ncbi:MAG: ribbon-helix-helix domain-containing protein [Candidatus Heimdallarchaeota archaeon]|nr:ribbon-helix-helix domain-containing protein [Candidatus Heimdallarchaeota archaeon]
MDKNRKKPFSFRMFLDLHEKVQALSAKERVPMSSIVNSALIEFFEKKEKS